jgi:hypothetical protein
MRGRYASGSDSSDGGGGGGVPLAAALRTLDLAAGLRRGGADYCAAAAELASILGSLYSARGFSKEARRLAERDAHAAVALCDGSAAALLALRGVARAAERVLPAQRRAALLREHRQRLVALARARDDGDGAAAAAPAADLPPECVAAIFAQLGDPIALARAACVCRAWRATAAADALWAPLLDLAWGGCAGAPPRAAAEAAGAGGAPAAAPAAGWPRARFAALAADAGDWLAPWRCRRVLVAGSVRWATPAAWRRAVAGRGPAGLGASAAAAFLSADQVVLWLHRRTPAALAQFSAAARERERALLRRHAAGGGAARAAAAAAPAAPPPPRAGELRFWQQPSIE